MRACVCHKWSREIPFESEKKKDHVMEHVKFYIYYKSKRILQRRRHSNTRFVAHRTISFLHFHFGCCAVYLWYYCYRCCCRYCSFHLSPHLPCSFIHIMLITSFFSLDLHSFVRSFVLLFFHSFYPRQSSIQSWIVCHFVKAVSLLLSVKYVCVLVCFCLSCEGRCFSVL